MKTARHDVKNTRKRLATFIGYLRAFMKLSTNATIDKIDVKIIPITRTNPNPPEIRLFGNLIPTKATRMSNVKRTATCEMILFSFFNPLAHNNRMIPNPTGINAVGD